MGPVLRDFFFVKKKKGNLLIYRVVHPCISEYFIILTWEFFPPKPAILVSFSSLDEIIPTYNAFYAYGAPCHETRLWNNIQSVASTCTKIFKSVKTVTINETCSYKTSDKSSENLKEIYS